MTIRHRERADRRPCCLASETAQTLAERAACRLMVDLLALAHDRGCEAELAAVLAADLAANRLPDMTSLSARFSPDPAALPTVVVHLTPLAAYEALLNNGLGEAA